MQLLSVGTLRTAALWRTSSSVQSEESGFTSPAYIIQIDLWMVSETSLVWTSAVIMLYAVCIETFYLTVVLCDDKLYKDLPLWSQKQPLQLLWILQL